MDFLADEMVTVIWDAGSGDERLPGECARDGFASNQGFNYIYGGQDIFTF